MAQKFAPALKSGIFVKVGALASSRWHTANNRSSGRTNCGIALGGDARLYMDDGPVHLDAVCRRCATRHLELATALGLVSAT